MNPRQLYIVDGNAREHPSKFGKFAAGIMAGGSVRDDECVPARPAPSYIVAGAWPLYRVEVVDGSRRSWCCGFFVQRSTAQRVADALRWAYLAGMEHGL